MAQCPTCRPSRKRSVASRAIQWCAPLRWFPRSGSQAARCRLGARAITESFCNMRWRKLYDIFEIGDRTSDLQDAVIAARGEAETICRGLQKRPRFGMDRRVGVEATPERESVARY